jgi:hypothetical protein
MDRKFFRFACATAILFVACTLMLPTAEARGLSGSRTTVTSTAAWWTAAVDWFADLVHIGRTNHTTSSGLTHQSAASQDTAQPTTGGCIDPLGKCKG